MGPSGGAQCQAHTFVTFVLRLVLVLQIKFLPPPRPQRHSNPPDAHKQLEIPPWPMGKRLVARLQTRTELPPLPP